MRKSRHEVLVESMMDRYKKRLAFRVEDIDFRERNGQH